LGASTNTEVQGRLTVIERSFERKESKEKRKTKGTS